MKNIVFPEFKKSHFSDVDVGTTFMYNGSAFTRMHSVYDANGSLMNAFNQSDSKLAQFASGDVVIPCPDAELLLEGRDE